MFVITYEVGTLEELYKMQAAVNAATPGLNYAVDGECDDPECPACLDLAVDGMTEDEKKCHALFHAPPDKDCPLCYRAAKARTK